MKKTIALIIILPFLFVLLASALFLALFDANQYKSDISLLVLEKTGRELTFLGDAELMLYPNFGMKLGAMDLANAQSFADEPLLSVQQVNVSVDIPSIFKLKPVINELLLDQLTLNLQKNKQGITNWQDLMSNAEPEPKTSTNEVVEDNSKAQVDTGKIDFAFNGLNIKNAQVNWQDEVTGERINVNNLSLKTGRIELDKAFPLSLEMQVQQQKKLNAQINLDANMKVSLTPERFTIDGLLLRVNAQGEQFNAEQINLDLAGQLSLQDFKQPKFEFDLHSTGIDLDALLGSSPAPSNQSTANLVKQNQPHPAKDVEIALPTSLLRELNLNGVIRVDELKVSNLRLENSQISLQAKQGLLQLSPLQTQLYQGASVNKITVDVRKKQPIYQAEMNLTAVQIKPLLMDLLDLDKVRGHATIEVDVVTQGSWVSQLKSNLNGDVNIRLKDGAFIGVNLRQEIEKVKAKLKNETFNDTQELETDFTELSLSGDIKQGIFYSDDLSLKSPFLRVSGKGQANIVSSTLDYMVNARLVDSLSGQASDDKDVKSALIPVNISGPFAQPKINVLLDDILKEKLEAKKQALKNKLEQQRKALEQQKKQRLEAEKAQLKAKLEAKKKAAKEKAEQELKDKLKSLLK